MQIFKTLYLRKFFANISVTILSNKSLQLGKKLIVFGFMKSLRIDLQNLSRIFPSFLKKRKYRYFSVEGSQKLRCFDCFVDILVTKAVKKKTWQGFFDKNMKNKTVVFKFQKIETEGTYCSRKENKHIFFSRFSFVY